MRDRRLGWPAVWGIAGVVIVLAQAIFKLFPLALELVDHELTPLQLGVLGGWLVMSAYSEGYRGFHKQFAPRVVARARHLSAHPRPLHVALAPAYCMGLLHATRKRLVVSWILTLAIVAVVIVVRKLAQPWRGIIDAGVVVGLTLGLASICYYVARALGGGAMPVTADVPRAQ
jgi:uncharacterized membrane protein YedE/YeeE